MIEKRRNLVFRFLPGLFLSGLLLLSGCSQDDVSDVPAGSRAIDFRAQGGMSSLKATTTNAYSIKSFVVSAHYSEASTWTAAADYLLRGVTVYRGEDDKWAYSPQAYFPTATDGSVEFFAYSPSSSVTRNVKQGYGLNEASTADQTITYKVPAPNGSVTVQEDFLVAYKSVVHDNYKDPVPLQFRHALSRILVSAKSELEIPIAITGLTLRNLYTEGTLDLNKVPSGDDENGWPYNAEINTTGDYVKWDSPAVLDNYSYSLPASGVSVGADYASVVGDDQGIFVLPQTTNGDPSTGAFKTDVPAGEFGLEIAYTINGVDAPEHAFVQFGDLNDIAGTGVTFETGRQYVLNLSFGSGSNDEDDEEDTDSDIVIGAKISFSTLVDGFDGPINAGLPAPPPPPFRPDSVQWSQSNIYYDATTTETLTFAESNTPVDKNLYQGVYFMSGSLIGISPGTDGNNFSKSDYLFIPDVGGNGKYYKVQVEDIADSGVSGVGLAFKTYISGSFSNWAGILSADGLTSQAASQALWHAIPSVGEYNDTDIQPYVNKDPGSNPDSRNDYSLSYYSGTTLYAKYKGDVCKYLATTKADGLSNGLNETDWRLPTSNEFSPRTGYNYNTSGTGDIVTVGQDYTTQWKSDGTNGGSFTGGTLEDGTAMLDGYAYYTLKWVFDMINGPFPFFPASGHRYINYGSDPVSVGNQSDVGRRGYYCSSSASHASLARILLFSSSYVYPEQLSFRSNGNSVRCVRDGENVAP